MEIQLSIEIFRNIEQQAVCMQFLVLGDAASEVRFI